jgi:hypothetical protein
MCPQTPRLSPEYSHKVGLQTIITGMPLQIRPVTRSGHAGPVTMGRITRGPPCWARPHGRVTSSQVFVRCRIWRRVSLPGVLSPLDQQPRRRLRAKGGIFAFAPTANNRQVSPDNGDGARVGHDTRQCGPVSELRRGIVGLLVVFSLRRGHDHHQSRPVKLYGHLPKCLRWRNGVASAAAVFSSRRSVISSTPSVHVLSIFGVAEEGT